MSMCLCNLLRILFSIMKIFSHLSAKPEVIFMSLHSKAVASLILLIMIIIMIIIIIIIASLIFLRGDFSSSLKRRLHLGIVSYNNNQQLFLLSSLPFILRLSSKLTITIITIVIRILIVQIILIIIDLANLHIVLLPPDLQASLSSSLSFLLRPRSSTNLLSSSLWWLA